MTERIAIYLRLSKEDDFVRDESNSISNQRDFIMRYIRRDRKLRNQEIIECIDDGYSGKNMKRPGMEKLLDLFQAYESFKEGLTGKGTYLQQKTAYEEMMDKLSENISRQERAIAEMEVPQEEAGTEMTVPELKKHLILDRNFSDLFIRQITVYVDRHIDVRCNFCEE